jgi:DNA adenine methylase
MQPAQHNFASPLRYPGGKGALCDFMKAVLLQNKLLDGDYVEIYAGGAGIAWPLLFEEYVQQVHINDINKSIYAFWQSVLNWTEDLCQLIRDVPVTMKEWHRQKAIQKDPNNHSILELGYSTFFLNRTNRSGIIKGGVIGGKEQTGEWKLDARFNKTDLIARIKRIARYRQRIHLYNLDAAVFVIRILPLLPKNSTTYLDPPYYVKGHGLYEDHYIHRNHIDIARLVSKRIKHPWIVSYDAAPEIIQLYSKYQFIQYNISYSAQERYAGSEVMFFSDRLQIPSVSNPARAQINSKTGFLF